MLFQCRIGTYERMHELESQLLKALMYVLIGVKSPLNELFLGLMKIENKGRITRDIKPSRLINTRQVPNAHAC